VVNQGSNSRWYSGSGLFRPVHLEVTSPLRVAPWGIAITTPDIDAAHAVVKVRVELLNASEAADALVRVHLLDPRDHTVTSGEASCAVPRSGATADLSLTVNKPSLWSPSAPVRYRARVFVIAGGKTVDETSASFGIRSLAWNAEQGFLLNEQPIKLRGGCFHHDHGSLGSASFAAAEERRVAILKAAGYNAVRCSHNMPAATLLDACDRAGMLVIDEAFDMWNQSKTPRDYSRFFKEDWRRDLDAMVRRDRNHPCVVMWSIGNEIPERFDAAGADTARALADHIRAVDASRPVTAAFNDVKDAADPFLSALDISGYNYCPNSFEPDHRRQPQRVMFTTESFPRDSFTYWSRVETLPCVIGDFIWTAWDYRGEAAIGHTLDEGDSGSYLRGWPNYNAFCGDFDVCGFVKPQGLYRQVLWDSRPVAILVEDVPPGEHTSPDYWGWRDELPHWTWPGLEGHTRTVRVYAKGDRVRLRLNGKEVGVQYIDPQYTATFHVNYAPGELAAEVLKGGNVVTKERLVTAGEPVALRLTPECHAIPSGAEHIAFIAVTAVDAKGALVPIADNEVRVSLTGAGRLAGFGNGDPRNTASVQQPEQVLWRGRALVVVRADNRGGTLTVEAAAGGLKTARTSMKIQ
jgi:beta-galactosidase